MRFTALLSLSILITTVLSSCSELGNRKNPLHEKEFRDIKDIPELKKFKYNGGSVIDFNKNKNGDYRFGIGHYENNENQICILEEFLKPDENGKPTYRILDTLFVGRLKEQEYLTYCNCRIDSTWDHEIVALVVAEDEKNFYDKIVKAWRADTKDGKFRKIENTSKINCLNESYGLEGCGGDDDFESNEDNSEPIIDSTNRIIDTLVEKSIEVDSNYTPK